jgi:hypothetical protein
VSQRRPLPSIVHPVRRLLAGNASSSSFLPSSLPVVIRFDSSKAKPSEVEQESRRASRHRCARARRDRRWSCSCSPGAPPLGGWSCRRRTRSRGAPPGWRRGRACPGRGSQGRGRRSPSPRIAAPRTRKTPYLWKSATTAAGSGTEELSRGSAEVVVATSSRRGKRVMLVDLGAPTMASWRIRWARAKMQRIL